jgi:hypothetical protein
MVPMDGDRRAERRHGPSEPRGMGLERVPGHGRGTAGQDDGTGNHPAVGAREGVQADITGIDAATAAGKRHGFGLLVTRPHAEKVCAVGESAR